MQSLEEACEEADHLMKLAQNQPSSIPLLQFKNGPSFFSIQNQLRRLYYEEYSKKESLPIQDLKATSLLLEKLVAKENLNTLIVNLYPGNKGYSLAMRQSGKGNNEKLTETVRWPYQMDTFLSYLDNGELPFMLVDLLEETYPEVFYSGCVIAEVRDYRQSYPHFSCNTHHILLQPTTQSVISDVNLLAAQSDLSNEEKVLLESELVLATQGPLCLDPSPSLLFLHATAQHQRNLLSTEPLRRCARKFSQVSVNRKRKLDQFTSQPNLPLLDVISRRKGRIGGQSRLHKKGLENISLEVPQIPVTRPLEMVPPPLTPPPEGSVDVAKYARAGEWPREISDCTPQLVEEYILEADRGTGQIYHIKISLLQRVSNLEYIGELYVDKDFKEGEKNGRTCRFPLGSRLQANHYIQQFSEIFTEEGRKSVRITHIVPGQPPRVSCTPGMRERDAKAQAQAKALARNTLAAVTSTTNINSQNQRIPVVNSSQTNNSLNNSIKNPADLVTVTNASSSSSTTLPTTASSNVNLVNALTSPPMSTGFTNILTSGILGSNQPSTVPVVNNMQSVNQIQAASVDSSQTQQLQLKQPIIQPQTPALTQPQSVPQPSPQPSPQTQSQQSPQSQQPSTQLRSHLETPSKIGGRTITNPEISALVTSLMNSAQQFQQQQQQQQLQRQLQQQTAAKSAGVTSTVGAATTNKTVPNTLLNLLNSGVSGVSAGTGAGTQKVRKMTLSHLLSAKVLTSAQQQQLQQQFLQQQQQQRVALPLPTLSAQLASPPANESVLQHSLSSHPQVRFSSPNRVTLTQPVQQQIQQQPVSSMLPSFEVEVPSASGSATVNVNVAVPQFDVLDSEQNAVSQVSSGGTVSSTSTAVPLYDITPSNFNTLVNNFNSTAVQNFDSTVTVNTLTSPNSSISVNNSASNFDLQSLVDSALVSDTNSTSVPNYEISVSNAGSVPNYEIRVPPIEEPVSNSNALTSDLSGQVAANFEIPLQNSANEATNGDLINQQPSGTTSYQISFPDLNSFDNSNTLTVHNSFDFTTATSYTTVPINTKTVAVSSNASGASTTSVSGSNLLGRILASGTASAAIRRLSANAAVASAASNSDNASNVHGLTALSALLAGTPSADNPIPGATSSLSNSSLLERLTASSSSTTASVGSNVAAPPPLQFAVPSPSKPSAGAAASLPVNSPSATVTSPATPKSPAVAVASPMSSPPSQAANPGQQGLTVSGVNLQGLNLASLQGAIGTIPGLQNVQVVSSGGTTGTVCGTAVSSSPHTMVLINPPLSMPVAQLMTSGVKAVNAQTGLRGITANSIQIPQGSGQAIQLVGTLQRAKAGGQVTKANVLAGRQLQATVLGGQRKLPTSNTVAGTAQMPASNQVFLSQQQLHLIQKGVPYTQYQLQQQTQPQPQQSQQQIQQQVQQKSGVLAAQLTSKRRRSNAADGAANK